nr:GAF domain-containing protein [Rhodococcus yunnanensis]
MSRRERLITLVSRPSTPPARWGIALAAGLILVEVLIVLLLKRISPENAFGALFLFGVLVMSAGWGFRLSIATSVASTAAYAYVHAQEGSESLVPAVIVFLAVALLTNVLVGQSRLRAEALIAAARDRERLHEQTAALARQQTALRRVATLVALRTDPEDIYRAVTRELADELDVEHVSLVRYDNDEFYTVVAARDDGADGLRLVPGEQHPLGGHNICTTVLATGAPYALEFSETTGAIAERLHGRGLLSGVGVPITVDGHTWGTVIVGSTDRSPKLEVCERLSDFADLVATAVYNSETRLELTRSRARVVAAADQARRAIERDLHDGAQQRIVSLGMDLRATQLLVPEEFDVLRSQLDRSVETLSQVHTDLQELSRGIHPAILSRGGLGPALKTLARRSSVPVSLTVDIPVRLPETVEVAAYYVVAEAMTNTAKYADASGIDITAVAEDGRLDLIVSDDGLGGADLTKGSGLIGLQDRIAAVGGTLTISSEPGTGTTLVVHIVARPGTTGSPARTLPGSR